MPRPPRFDLPGVPRHIVQRDNNRQSVFFDETDDWLGKATRHYGVAVHAWCLMTNHVHPVRSEMVLEPSAYPWSSYR
jgi:putative transposase